MKKTLFIAQLSMLMLLLSLGSVYAQSSNPGNTPPRSRGGTVRIADPIRTVATAWDLV
jgi:hypothetical protein